MREITEPAREIDVVHETDVLVVGFVQRSLNHQVPVREYNAYCGKAILAHFPAHFD